MGTKDSSPALCEVYDSRNERKIPAQTSLKRLNMIWLRRLYDWVLSWAQTPYGAVALFVLAFTESSFFPVPPDVLLIALAISIPAKALKYALLCSVGSVLGGMAGYLIGSEFMASQTTGNS